MTGWTPWTPSGRSRARAGSGGGGGAAGPAATRRRERGSRLRRSRARPPGGPHGRREIALCEIRGTVEPSRAAMFDAVPPAAAARTRWERVWVAEQRGQALPPISVAQIGDATRCATATTACRSRGRAARSRSTRRSTASRPQAAGRSSSSRRHRREAEADPPQGRSRARARAPRALSSGLRAPSLMRPVMSAMVRGSRPGTRSRSSSDGQQLGAHRREPGEQQRGDGVARHGPLDGDLAQAAGGARCCASVTIRRRARASSGASHEVLAHAPTRRGRRSARPRRPCPG